MLNLIWPSLKRRSVTAVGAFSRILHWTGVVLAGLCVLLALEFAVEGWATHLCRTLVIVALALTFGTRALRYMLAHE